MAPAVVPDCGLIKAMTVASCVTLGRIVLALLLLWTEPLSSAFFAVYILAGLSDALDGFLARRTHTETALGARLDSAADLLLVGICLVRLRPFTALPRWLWAWVILIALLRLGNLLWGRFRQGQWIMLHTVWNKVTGGVLFLLPFTLGRADIRLSGGLVCLIATVAALDEGRRIRKGAAK